MNYQIKNFIYVSNARRYIVQKNEYSPVKAVRIRIHKEKRRRKMKKKSTYIHVLGKLNLQDVQNV